MDKNKKTFIIYLVATICFIVAAIGYFINDNSLFGFSFTAIALSNAILGWNSYRKYKGR